MYVVEQSGALRIVRDGRVTGTALDLGGNLSTGNEQGFLGMTFSPDGRRLYVDYTDADGDTNVDEYRMRGDIADPARAGASSSSTSPTRTTTAAK